MIKEMNFIKFLFEGIVLAVMCVLIGMISYNVADANEILDYSEEAISDSLMNYSYEENPYYLEGLEQYVETFNEFYESVGTEQKVEIIQLEDALKEAGISNSLIKKILSAEGKSVLEESDFKRLEEEEDKSLFFSKGKYYEVSSKAKDDIDEIDFILNVLFYLGDLKDNKPNGEGALFVLSNSGTRLLYAGSFKKGKFDGKGILFGRESFGSVILGQGKFKDHETNGKFTIYNTSDLQQVYQLYRDKWSEYKEYYYNDYSESEKKQVISNLFKKGTGLELMYITEMYEEVNFDNFFNIRIKYPVIKSVILYKGECKKDKYSGKGTLYGNTGTLWYEGEFQGGKYSGKGTLYYAYTGIKQYEGQFHNGMMKGKGTLYNTDGTIRKEGKFDNEKVDNENEVLEERGIYEKVLEKIDTVELQKLFE